MISQFHPQGINFHNHSGRREIDISLRILSQKEFDFSYHTEDKKYISERLLSWLLVVLNLLQTSDLKRQYLSCQPHSPQSVIDLASQPFLLLIGPRVAPPRVLTSISHLSRVRDMMFQATSTMKVKGCIGHRPQESEQR